ncbi:MAG: beta-N-acetylhexosaminidase [Francisellaceae bacterium]
MHNKHFCIGIESTTLNEADKKRIRHPAVVCIILFSRNFDNSAQLIRLNKAIKIIRPDILIAVDHEGGRVQRFKSDGFHPLEPPFNLADKMDKIIAEHAKTLVLDLKKHGLDISFAPVVDCYHPQSRIIKERAFSANPKEICRIARIYIDAMHRYHMPATLKHFPGHGSTVADTHLEIAIDHQPFTSLAENDLLPFISLIHEHKADAIMVGHVLYPQIDTKNIASQSPIWIADILRKRLKFDGIIFSDDLGMFAATATSDPESVCCRFFAAGGDIALLGNDFKLIDKVLAATPVSDYHQESVFTRRWKRFCSRLG